MAKKQIDDSLSNRGITATETDKIAKLQMKITEMQSYAAGQMSYDPDCKCHISDTGFTDVRNNIGREDHILVYNNTISQIDNGVPVSVTGVVTGEVPHVEPTTNTTELSALGFAGVATMNIPPSDYGIATSRGLVHDVDTGVLAEGFIYAGPSGDYTQTRPIFPAHRLLVGGIVQTGVTDGIISVNYQTLRRRSASRNYSFTSASAAAGVHYRAGFYDWSATSATLTNASLTVAHGAADLSRAAHVGIVAAAAGTVDTGQVGIQVTGTLDSELGTQTASQTAVITDDITTLTTDMMVECIEKFSGEVTISLYTVSGSPTTYSVTINYGYSKYEDFINQDGTVVGFECVWEAGAADVAFNIELIHHRATGWTYAASGFIPGDGNICERLVDQAIDSEIAAGVEGAYKRLGLNTFIEASVTEGGLIRITTSSTNSIRSMDMTVVAFSEELD